MDITTGQTTSIVHRDTFNFILNAIEDLITKEVTKFKEPVLPDRQLGLTK